MPVMSGSWPNLVRQVAFAINGYALVSSVLSLATIVSALLAPDHSITWLLLLLATVVASALMGLVFLSSGTGHDEAIDDRIHHELDDIN